STQTTRSDPIVLASATGYSIIARPATLCSTFGRADFMRVPLPAARITVEHFMRGSIGRKPCWIKREFVGPRHSDAAVGRSFNGGTPATPGTEEKKGEVGRGQRRGFGVVERCVAAISLSVDGGRVDAGRELEDEVLEDLFLRDHGVGVRDAVAREGG